MSKIYSILMLISLSAVFATAQPIVNNFEIKNNEVTWQKVFNTNLSFDELYQAVTSSGKLQEINKGDNLITGHFNDFHPDYEGAGFNVMNTGMYISNGKFFAFVTIDFKPGKYRVTIKNIRFEANIANMQSNDKLESCALKGHSFRNSFVKRDSKIFDYTFDKDFSFEANTEENW